MVDNSSSGGLGAIDQYELIRELGGGGFGTVYLAKDTVAVIDVAVKGLPPLVRNNKEELENIRRNFALVSRLHHPNIAAALTLHPVAKAVYNDRSDAEKLRVFNGDTLVVMQYAPGVTLSQWRKQFPENKVPIDQALEIVRQVASALDYAHREKILHRDIKPANVMIETAADGKVTARVLDFGLAAEIRSSMGRVSCEIHDTSGTRPYMAPEQWLGDKQGSATDQYALAVLFHELVTGEVPFASVFQTGDPIVMMNVVGREPPKLQSDLPKLVRLALAKALTKTPDERFSSCAEFVEAIEGKVKVKSSSGEKSQFSKLTAIFIAALCAGAGVWYWQDAKVKEQARIVAEQKAEEVRLAAEKQAEVVELVKLRTQITIKIDDAKGRMEKVAAFRSESDGFQAHLDVIDGKWKIVTSAKTEPQSVVEAKTVFDMINEADNVIAQELAWLQTNKAARDKAKEIESDISASLESEMARFKTAEYACDMYALGMRLRKEGNDALSAGDFPKARQKLAAAKEKLSNALSEARTFCIKTHLDSAEAYNKASKWQLSLNEAEKVIGWDSSNRKALQFKCDAEKNLIPSLWCTVMINDRVLTAKDGKVKIGGKEYSFPFGWKKLEKGQWLNAFAVEYQESGRRYIGKFDSITVDWAGEKNVVIALTEHKGPRHGNRKTLTLPGGATMEMIYCAPGTFMMGSPATEEERRYDETQHRVTLTKGFWLGKYEVTQAQWQSVMGENPSYYKGDMDLPVEWAFWEDCQKFIQRVNAQSNCGARLPTEAEWEYACRAGTTTAYHWGNALNGDKANCNGKDYPYGTEVKGPYLKKTTRVGSYDANPWGFYDMHGNVQEWCQDWYGGPYPGVAETDPIGSASGVRRVLRGGSFDSGARSCRSAYRNGSATCYRSPCTGFRLACSAGPHE